MINVSRSIQVKGMTGASVVRRFNIISYISSVLLIDRYYFLPGVCTIIRVLFEEVFD
jgi:hypothetical protein